MAAGHLIDRVAEVNAGYNDGSFSIIPRVYEKGLDEKYGIVLGELKNQESIYLQGRLEENVSFDGGYYHSPKKIRNEILKKYRDVPDFCAMKVNSVDDLFGHIKKIHEMSYSHYAWAKNNKHWELRSFPRYCCGFSSRNLFLNLMKEGYPNAARVYNMYADHTYVVLPFLLKEDRGFIVVDPTSDQLLNNGKNIPRNNLFVAFGGEWSYRTDRASGAELYPSVEDESVFSNLCTLRKRSGLFSRPFFSAKKSRLSTEGDSDIGKYFEKVFENPIDLSKE